MTVTAVCASKGVWGASTLALLVGAAWPGGRRVVVAECDPNGNALAARFELSPLVGMTSLVLDRRRLVDDGLDAHVQSAPGGLEVLVGPVTPDAARSLDREMEGLGRTLFPIDVDVVADCGRMLVDSRGQAEIITMASEVLVIVGGDAAGLAHAQWTTERIAAVAPGTRTECVLMGACPFPLDDVRHALHADRIRFLPSDPRTAGMACGIPGRPKYLERGQLTRVARAIACQLVHDRASHATGADRLKLDTVDDVAAPEHVPASVGEA